MVLTTSLIDGNGSKNRVSVDINSGLVVSPQEPSISPVGTSSRFRFFSQLVSSNGDGTGTTNMNVDGSVTPQLFTIDSDQEYDIRIMKIMIFIEDTAVTHNGFGALGALTNGVDISVFEAGQETFLINAAKKFADLIEQTLAEKPFGDDATSFELASTTGTQDAQILPMNIGVLVPGGIRIGRGTLAKLQVEINDDLTGLTNFTVRAVGYRHYP